MELFLFPSVATATSRAEVIENLTKIFNRITIIQGQMLNDLFPRTPVSPSPQDATDAANNEATTRSDSHPLFEELSEITTESMVDPATVVEQPEAVQ